VELLLLLGSRILALLCTHGLADPGDGGNSRNGKQADHHDADDALVFVETFRMLQ
jgi:hypothetical protein